MESEFTKNEVLHLARIDRVKIRVNNLGLDPAKYNATSNEKSKFFWDILTQAFSNFSSIPIGSVARCEHSEYDSGTTFRK